MQTPDTDPATMRSTTPASIPPHRHRAIALSALSLCLGLSACVHPQAGTPQEAAPATPLAVTAAATAPTDRVDALLKLASTSGCMACHQVDRAETPDTEAEDETSEPPAPRPPVAPAFRDVAQKYRQRPDATQRLTATILGGSNPFESHWKYQVSGLAMPPNRLAVSEPDARKLVQWILSLDDPE